MSLFSVRDCPRLGNGPCSLGCENMCTEYFLMMSMSVVYWSATNGYFNFFTEVSLWVDDVSSDSAPCMPEPEEFWLPLTDFLYHLELVKDKVPSCFPVLPLLLLSGHLNMACGHLALYLDPHPTGHQSVTSQGAGWWLWLCFSSFLVLEDFLLFCSLFLIPSSLVLFQMFFATFLLAFLCHFRGRGLGCVSTVCHFTRMRSQGQLLTLGDCEKWAVHADRGFKEREMHSQRVGTAKHWRMLVGVRIREC